MAAWERALNPKVASEYSYIMYSIKGAEDYNQGKITDFSQVGVKAKESEARQALYDQQRTTRNL